MYVKTHKDGLKEIKLPDMDSPAEFSSNNIAQVSAEDGAVLIDKHPNEFEEHES